MQKNIHSFCIVYHMWKNKQYLHIFLSTKMIIKRFKYKFLIPSQWKSKSFFSTKKPWTPYDYKLKNKSKSLNKVNYYKYHLNDNLQIHKASLDHYVVLKAVSRIQDPLLLSNILSLTRREPENENKTFK